MPIKAVIFDFDGTIADTERFNLNGLKYMCEQKGLDFNEEIYRKYFDGRRLVDSLQMLLEPLGRASELDELVKLKRSYDANFPQEVAGYIDTINWIKRLKGNCRLAIATGTRRMQIDMAIEKFGLQNCFEVIITAENCTKGKPDPEPFLNAINGLGLESAECLAIEDTEFGIVSAKAAKMPCLAVTHTHLAPELSKADYVVESLDDVEVKNGEIVLVK